MKKIISTFLFLLTLGATTSLVSAWVVPGSITKGSYTTSNTCNTNTNSYSPSGGFCAPGTCTNGTGVWFDTGESEVGNDGNCSFEGTSCTAGEPNRICCWSQWHAVGDACKHNSGNNLIIVDKFYVMCNATVTCTPTTPVTTGTLNFDDYTWKNENPSYGMSNNFRKLAADVGETCNRWADGTDHTPPTKTGILSCGSGNEAYYVGGSDGLCSTVGKTDNCITSYDQFGSITRATTGCDSPGSAAAPTATCTVEGRQATPDDGGPSVSVSNANVFTGNEDAWCNINKYIDASYGITTPELSGCSYYKNLGNHTANPADKHPDLLENLSINVSDVSGISEVRVELGNCDATYSLPTGIAQILPNASSGIDPAYTSFTLAYNTSVTIDGTVLPSLRQKLTGSSTGRIDSCLLEGKNYLRVTAKDQARSDANAVTLSSNTDGVDYNQQSKYLRVDNNGARLELTGLAKNIAESNVSPALAPSCFIRWATIGDPNPWKNFSILWSLKSGDPFGANAVDNCPICTELTSATLNCSGKPAGSIWISPGGVDPNTGNFTGNTCDGLGPIPDTNSCQWGCSSGYTWNGSACVVPAPACTGVLPVNSVKTSTADQNQPYSYSATPTAACTFSCANGSVWNAPNNTCDLVPPTCGSAENQTYGSAAEVPPGNLCSDGFQPTVSTVSPMLIWSCNASVSCSAFLATGGACGTASGSTVAIPPTSNLCADGSTPDVSGTGPWNWSCPGMNGGPAASCSAQKIDYCIAGGVVPCIVMPGAPINASCGTSANTCNSGSPTGYSAGSCGGSASWNCNSINGGTNASCTKANSPCSSGLCSMTFHQTSPVWEIDDTDIAPGTSRTFTNTTYNSIGADLVQVGDTFSCPAAPTGGGCGYSISKIGNVNYIMEETIIPPWQTHTHSLNTEYWYIQWDLVVTETATNRKLSCPGPVQWSYPCFIWGTQVTLASGETKSIEDIEIGETIRTYDEVTKTIMDRPVIQTFHHESKESTLFTFQYGDTSVTSNDVHLIYLPTEDTYQSARKIYERWKSWEDIHLLNEAKETILVSDIVMKQENVPLYNLHIDGVHDTGETLDIYKPNHNYFANGVLVHNEKDIGSLNDAWDNYMLQCGWLPNFDVCTPSESYPRSIRCYGSTTDRTQINACYN